MIEETPMPHAKIFCIGFHKTGTSSLAVALKLLGYRVRSIGNEFNDANIARTVYEKAFALVEKYDAFRDNPWPIIYQELDRKFPGSKFILTLRPPASWMNSVVRYFGRRTTPMREWIYGAGCPLGNEELYLARYERHNREVREYFRDRPDDLLVMSLTEGEGWEKLCRFLGKEMPAVPFPHANNAEKRGRRAKR
jgi:hypothetical protein